MMQIFFQGRRIFNTLKSLKTKSYLTLTKFSYLLLDDTTDHPTYSGRFLGLTLHDYIKKI